MPADDEPLGTDHLKRDAVGRAGQGPLMAVTAQPESDAVHGHVGQQFAVAQRVMVRLRRPSAVQYG